MTDGDGQGICGIEGIELWADAEQRLNHPLDLVLFGTAVSHDADFHFQRRVLADSKPGFGSQEQGHSADVSQLEGRLGVHCIKHFLDCHRLRGEVCEDATQLARDFLEALFKRLSRLGANDSGGDQAMGAAIGIDDTETGSFRSAIYSGDSHLKRAIQDALRLCAAD